MARSKTRMTTAVRRAVKSATHLEPEDMALVAVALELAAAIDSAAGEDDEAAWRKQTGWISPHLVGALRALGLTPDNRDLRDRHKPRPPNALDRLRAERRGLTPEAERDLADATSRTEEMRLRGARGWKAAEE